MPMEEGDLKKDSGFWFKYSEFEIPVDCAGEIATQKLRGETQASKENLEVIYM